jgi:2-polyprenyl-3-methyl-5-hydroxy-6-metoxy-1,4-benzoquinol methylase
MNMHLGEMHAASYQTDPKHGAFVWARYNFVARMLAGSQRVLEVGCGDTSFAPVVAAVVDQLVGIDQQLYTSEPKIQIAQHDILEGPYGDPATPWDAVYALDVLEHIRPEVEDVALSHMRYHLRSHGTMIIGMPSQESQVYASSESLKHHCNCKTEPSLLKTMRRHFRNVYPFGMNDSVLLCSYPPFMQYRFVIATGKK